jgi:hypothetical protein
MSTPFLVKVRCRGESYSGVSNTTRKHVHASRIKQFQRLHYKTKFMTHPEKPPVIPVAQILKKNCIGDPAFASLVHSSSLCFARPANRVFANKFIHGSRCVH